MNIATLIKAIGWLFKVKKLAGYRRLIGVIAAAGAGGIQLLSDANLLAPCQAGEIVGPVCDVLTWSQPKLIYAASYLGIIGHAFRNELRK